MTAPTTSCIRTLGFPEIVTVACMGYPIPPLAAVQLVQPTSAGFATVGFLSLRVQVQQYKVSTQNQHYNS